MMTQAAHNPKLFLSRVMVEKQSNASKWLECMNAVVGVCVYSMFPIRHNCVMPFHKVTETQYLRIMK